MTYQLQRFRGTLHIQGNESFLDDMVMALSRPCCWTLECMIQAARDHFVAAGYPIGSPLDIDGNFVRNEPDGQGGFRDVLHVVIDNSSCFSSSN